MPPDALHVLVVDDEPLARRRLLDLLDERPEVARLDTAENGEEAVEALRDEAAPDLVFLDVQMPGRTGLDVVRAVGPEAMPVTVFVTAYDQYALRAFELAALDYLLKPFDDERFEQAFARARQMVRLRTVDDLHDRFLTLLQHRDEARDEAAPEGEEDPAAEQAPLERIAVTSRGQMRIVPVEEIRYVTADGSYLELHTADDTHLVRERMKTLADRLDPDHFFRIHRSVIVRLDRIEALLRQSGGRYAVRLKDGTRLPLSRSRREALEERLGLEL